MVTRGRSQGKHTNAALPFALRISDVAWFFGVACPTGTAEVAHTSLFLSAVTDVAYVLRWYRFYSRLWDGARSEVGWRLSFFPIACRARRRPQAPQLTKNPTSRGIREVGSPRSSLGPFPPPRTTQKKGPGIWGFAILCPGSAGADAQDPKTGQ